MQDWMLLMQTIIIIMNLLLLLHWVLARIVEMTIQPCHHVKSRWVSYRACLRGRIWQGRFTFWIAYAWVLGWELGGDLRAILVAATEFGNAEASTVAAKGITGAASRYWTEASELYRPLPSGATVMHTLHGPPMTSRHMAAIFLYDIQWEVRAARCPPCHSHPFLTLISKLLLIAVFLKLQMPLLVWCSYDVISILLLQLLTVL